MALGLYKPGQGYWTRVLTAVGLGVIALAGAMWLWQQLQAVPVGKKAWTMDIAAVVGAPTVNQEVALFADTEAKTRLGTATVTEIAPGGKSITVGALHLDKGADASTARRLEASPTAGGPDAFSASIARKQGVAAFNILYVQAGVACAVILFATGFIYWLTAIRPSSNEFFIAVDSEMRKVNWSTRREVLGSTWVVIAVCGGITCLLFVVDFFFGAFFKWAGVIGG